MLNSKVIPRGENESPGEKAKYIADRYSHANETILTAMRVDVPLAF